MEKKGAARISIKLTGQMHEQPKHSVVPDMKRGVSLPQQREEDLPHERRAVQEPVSATAQPPGEDQRLQLAQEMNAIDRLQQIRSELMTHAEPPASADTGGEARRELAGVQDESDFAADEPGAYSSAPRRSNRSSYLRSNPLKWFVSAISAIAVGLLFGFLVLALFTQGQLNESYRSVIGETIQSATTLPPGQPGTTAPEQAGENQPFPGQPIQPLFLQLPERRLFMAQVGAFKEKETAQVAIDSLVEKGYPHFLFEADESYYLFTATTSNRDDILGLASSFKNKGMDVYVKEVVLPGLKKELALTAEDKDTSTLLDQTKLQTFFENGMELSGTVTNWSGRFLSDPQSGGLSPENEQTIKELHRKFLDASGALQSAAPQDWQAHLTGMINGLNKAVAAVEQTKSAIKAGKIDNAQSHAWQIQNGAISFLEHYTLWAKKQQP